MFGLAMEGTSVDRGTELGAHLGAGLISVSHYPHLTMLERGRIVVIARVP
jgi:hypothetical protein